MLKFTPCCKISKGNLNKILNLQPLHLVNPLDLYRESQLWPLKGFDRKVEVQLSSSLPTTEGRVKWLAFDAVNTFRCPFSRWNVEITSTNSYAITPLDHRIIEHSKRTFIMAGAFHSTYHMPCWAQDNSGNWFAAWQETQRQAFPQMATIQVQGGSW